MRSRGSKKEFFIKIILPTLLAFSLFTITIFAVIIPSFEKNILERKREVITELTNAAWSILEEFHQKVNEGEYTEEEAKEEAETIIKYLRYGDERKDYFWITDMQPRMIVHPYRSELNNTDLSNYEDPAGKKLFNEFVEVVKSNGEGYVDYMWQWKDDSTKIVPKLSFVKGFEPWGWIIGTGIYIEDVKEEISELTENLIYISLAILAVLAFILSFIGQQSLRIEKKKEMAEDKLRESEAKYRTLVEASTEGLVMMLDGEYVYANKALLNILGYEDEQVKEVNIEKILCGNETESSSGNEYFRKLKKGNLPGKKIEAQLRNQSGSLVEVILFASVITLGAKSGYSIIVRDVSISEEIDEDPEESKRKYRQLIDNVDLGFFRLSLKLNGKFQEANSAVLDMLGYKDKNEFRETGLFEILHDKQLRKTLYRELLSKGKIEKTIAELKKKSGELSTFSITAVLVKDENNKHEFCEGIIEDISGKLKSEEEKENLIVELQTSLNFLNEPVAHFLKSAVVCNMNWSIAKVAHLMSKKKYSAALIVKESDEYIGIVTDHDLRERVIVESYDVSKPVSGIMSSPIISIQSNSLVFQALLFMNEKSVRHLAVKDPDGEILGVISSEELLQVHLNSTTYLISEIEAAESVDDLIIAREKLPRIVKNLVNSGAKTKNITQIITSIFDSIVNKLISFAVDELGEPPAEFSFVALGSAGRKEQTLISDQDNAIIFEDVPEEKRETTEEYFNKMAKEVCKWLNDCGYVYCKGEAMASNPKWCKPLSVWKNYFHTWITNSEPQDLIDVNIFFDFRSVYGKKELTTELRNYLFEISEGQAGFYQHSVKNSLLHKPPLGLLGNIVVASKGEHSETFDIKAATMPVIDYARIYSIKHKVNCTNTIERLYQLQSRGVINKTTYEELLQAYNFLMQLRFKHHSNQLISNTEADNFINPEKFTKIEQNTLKNAFSQIQSIQKKLSYDFTGNAF